MKDKALSLAAIILLLSSLLPHTALAAKRKVAIGEIAGSGTSEHELTTLRNLIENAVIDHKRARLVTENATMILNANLNRLGRSYILVMTADLSSGRKRSKKVKMESFDEVDVAVTRLVAALIEGKDVEETAERGVVLEEEQEKPKRVKAINSYGVYFGGAVPVTDAMNSHKMLYSFGASYLFDLDNFLLEIRADLQPGYNEVTMNISSFTLGGQFLWHQGRTAAIYTGAEVGIGHVEDANADGTTGFAVAGDIGALFLRHATVNLDVRIRTLVVANTLNGEIPVTTGLVIGILF